MTGVASLKIIENFERTWISLNIWLTEFPKKLLSAKSCCKILQVSGNFENYSKSQVGSKILQVSENLKKNCHGCLSLLDNLFLFAGSCRPLECVSTLLFYNCWVNKWWCYEFLKNLIKILKNWQSVKILKIWLSPRSVENYSKCQKIWKLFKVWNLGRRLLLLMKYCSLKGCKGV